MGSFRRPDRAGACRTLVAEMRPPKLTVIGLDAATFDVIDPLVEAGHLPNIARILREGTSGVLRSTTHPLTPHAWSTMVTGVNAARHGVWDFIERGEIGLRAARDQRELPSRPRRLGPARPLGATRRARQHPVHVAGAERGRLRDRGHGRGRAREGDDASRPSSSTSCASGSRPLELDHRFPVTKTGEADLDFVRRAAEQKVDAALWLDGALRAGAALGRLHGGRPHPPRRVAGLGRAGTREQRRRDVPDPRRGRRPARTTPPAATTSCSSPTTAAAR